MVVFEKSDESKKASEGRLVYSGTKTQDIQLDYVKTFINKYENVSRYFSEIAEDLAKTFGWLMPVKTVKLIDKMAVSLGNESHKDEIEYEEELNDDMIEIEDNITAIFESIEDGTLNDLTETSKEILREISHDFGRVFLIDTVELNKRILLILQEKDTVVSTKQPHFGIENEIRHLNQIDVGDVVLEYNKNRGFSSSKKIIEISNDKIIMKRISTGLPIQESYLTDKGLLPYNNGMWNSTDCLVMVRPTGIVNSRAADLDGVYDPVFVCPKCRDVSLPMILDEDEDVAVMCESCLTVFKLENLKDPLTCSDEDFIKNAELKEIASKEELEKFREIIGDAEVNDVFYSKDKGGFFNDDRNFIYKCPICSEIEPEPPILGAEHLMAVLCPACMNIFAIVEASDDSSEELSTNAMIRKATDEEVRRLREAGEIQ